LKERAEVDNHNCDIWHKRNYKKQERD